MQNLTEAQAETLNRAIQIAEGIISYYAKKLNVDEETALKMVQQNIDSPNVTGAINFAAEIFSNDKVYNALTSDAA